jgi:hypothetical protein
MSGDRIMIYHLDIESLSAWGETGLPFRQSRFFVLVKTSKRLCKLVQAYKIKYVHKVTLKN